MGNEKTERGIVYLSKTRFTFLPEDQNTLIEHSSLKTIYFQQSYALNYVLLPSQLCQTFILSCMH